MPVLLSLAGSLLFSAFVIFACAQPESRSGSPDAEQSKSLLSLRDEVYDVTFVGKDHGWVVGHNGLILHTRDGGRRWKKQAAGTLRALFSVSCADITTCYVAGSGGLILKTADGGKTWRAQETPTDQSLLALTFVDAERGWAAGADGTVLFTDSGGEQWLERSLGQDITLNTVNFVTPDQGWVMGEFGMIFTTGDGGKTWAMQKTVGNVVLIKGLNTYFGGMTIFGSAVLNREEVWAVGIEGVAVRTSDCGTTWEQISMATKEPLFDVAFAGELGVAVGARGQVLVSRDAGRTWEAVPRDRLQMNSWFRAVSVTKDGAVFAVGGRGSIFHSPDGGRNWRKLDM